MTKKRLIFYFAFVTYMLCTFIFTYLLDGHLDPLKLVKYIPWFKYLSFYGLLLFIIDLFWVLWCDTLHKRDHDKLRKEIDQLKAKNFDRQESSINLKEL